MNAAQQFFDEVLDGFASMARGWGSTPSVLTAAAASVLSVDGAGISLIDDALRVPLGASSDVVSVAEQLQVTVGDGPCLSAAAAREPLAADDPVRDAPNLVISPHCSPESKFFRAEMFNLLAENLNRLSDRRPLLNIIAR